MGKIITRVSAARDASALRVWVAYAPGIVQHSTWRDPDPMQVAALVRNTCRLPKNPAWLWRCRVYHDRTKDRLHATMNRKWRSIGPIEPHEMLCTEDALEWWQSMACML